MREDGVVIDYNGFIGKIRSAEGIEYLLLKKDIMDNDILNVNDKVIFTPDNYKTIEYEEKIARFIRKLEK